MTIRRVSRNFLWRYQPEIEFLLLVVFSFVLLGFYEFSLSQGASAFERAFVRMVPGASAGSETWNLLE